MRKALEVRDGGCVFPFCDRPPSWSHAHHIKHWADGGTTSLDNAALLCSRHHHVVHSQDYRVFIGPDGRATVDTTPPDHHSDRQ
ncbi:MAG: HNH endonuclease signature motif containing protein [Candidatus Nanopelagicales bacterium]